MPPPHLAGIEALMLEGRFEPADDLAAWIKATFIAEGGPIENEHHAHLQEARLGVLWTSEPNERQQRSVIGQAELMPPRGGKWLKGRLTQQLRDWFQEVPDFLLTFYAPAALELTDAQFCALVEHELYHCGQEIGEDGPKFHRDGSPCFAMRGHDVEEFTGVVERYGAVMPDVARMVAAANRPPLIAASSIAQACGTCLRLVA